MRHIAGVIIGLAICVSLLAQTAPTAGQYGVAYASFAPLNAELFVADAGGSNARPLSPDPGWDANASFSMDGQWVVFTSNRQGSADISYSPDGTGLISATGTRALAHNGILSMRADGANRRIIFDDPERSSVAAVFSPKGDRIAFGLGSFFGGMIGRPATVSNIALVNADGSGLRLLTTGDVNDGFPSWSPDGRRLVFRTASALGKGLRILDLTTGQTTVLTDGSYIDNFPSWSPDGSTIAFTRNMQGNYDIFTIRPDGSGLQRLTTDPGNDAHSTWSPTGSGLRSPAGRGGSRTRCRCMP
jgi:TolB protein